MAQFIYFAYGSNMASARLQRRTPSAQPMGMATLANYTTTFEKMGLDGSGKCGIYEAEGDEVYGVLFTVKTSELPELDAAEGQGVAYQSTWVSVTTAEGENLKALTYIPLSRDEGLRPKCWYRKHVLRGAREFNLPQALITKLENITVWPEENTEVLADELSIY